MLNCDLNSHLDSAWIENTPRFTGFVLESAGTEYLILSLPGEALVELGWEIRNGNRLYVSKIINTLDWRTDTLKLGFERTLLFGYSNNHMGYFATPNEYRSVSYTSLSLTQRVLIVHRYIVGGYESLLTFWGIDTAERVRRRAPLPFPFLSRLPCGHASPLTGSADSWQRCRCGEAARRRPQVRPRVAPARGSLIPLL